MASSCSSLVSPENPSLINHPNPHVKFFSWTAPPETIRYPFSSLPCLAQLKERSSEMAHVTALCSCQATHATLLLNEVNKMLCIRNEQEVRVWKEETRGEEKAGGGEQAAGLKSAMG